MISTLISFTNAVVLRYIGMWRRMWFLESLTLRSLKGELLVISIAEKMILHLIANCFVLQIMK